jgi:TonB family protein
MYEGNVNRRPWRFFTRSMGFSRALVLSCFAHGLLLFALAGLVGSPSMPFDVLSGLSSEARQGSSGAASDNGPETAPAGAAATFLVSLNSAWPAATDLEREDSLRAAAVNSPDLVGALSERARINSRNYPPRYPYAARLANSQGRVVLSIEVLPSGSVGRVVVLESSGLHLLDSAAMNAVRKWIFFDPGELFLSQSMIINHPVEFVLN